MLSSMRYDLIGQFTVYSTDSPGGNPKRGDRVLKKLMSPFNNDITKYCAQYENMIIFTMTIKSCTRTHKINMNNIKGRVQARQDLW